MLGVHLTLVFAIVGSSSSWSLLGLGIPIGQLGLVTIWAALVARNPLLRMGAPACGILFCWFVLSRLLPWSSGEPASAGWAVALLTQVFTIFLFIACYQRWTREDNGSDEYRLQGSTPASAMSIGSIALWMTAVACTFAFIRYGQQHWQWQASFLQWELMSSMPIIGITNGLLASILLWCVCDRRSRMPFVGKASISVSLVLLLALLQSSGINWLSATNAMEAWHSFLLLTSQSVVVSASMAVVNLDAACSESFVSRPT
ncbi:MAG: hypothetical protein ACE361_00790 [Aureliella sp.]